MATGGGHWVVKSYENIHTFSVDLEPHTNQNVVASLIAGIVKDKYAKPTHVFPPAAIIDLMKYKYAVTIDYTIAWRDRELAIGIVMGSSVESFEKLPVYFHRLKQVNPGMITHIERHDDGHFKYCFMSPRVSIRGFKSNIRPVLAIDGTHLRGRYVGTLLLATAMDGNSQLYPLAFSIVDSENNASWNWFLTKLHEIVGEIEGLVIISDRHASILKGVPEVFPNAYHGICMFHLKNNVVTKFRNVDVASLLFKAAKTYDAEEHRSCINAILVVDHQVYHYLTHDSSLEQWACVYFPGRRYSIMTTNIAESMNSVLRDVRVYPPVALMDTIVTKLSSWYVERHKKALQKRGKLTTWAEKIVTDRDQESRRYNVREVNNSTFNVRDGRKNATVDLHARTCTCRRFQLDKLPRSHALATATSKQISKFDLVSYYYFTYFWLLAYAEPIHPVGHDDQWNTPDGVSSPTLLFPKKKPRGVGRPTTSRILSQGEERILPNCSKCKKPGHNRRTCKNPAQVEAD